MASLSPTRFTISTKSSQKHRFNPNSPGKPNIKKIGVTSASQMLVNKSWKFNRKEQGNLGLQRSTVLLRSLPTCQESVSSGNPRRWFSSTFSMPIGSFTASDKSVKCEIGFTQIDDLVRVLHKSARSFSVSIKRHELARSDAELSKAWVGVDVHAWHRHISYQAAAYALLNTAMEARFMLLDEHGSDPRPMHKILSPKINMLLECIECQLNTRDPRLVQWFKLVKLPVLSGCFIPLLRRWSAVHGRSGVAVNIFAVSCCVAVGKLGDRRISCPMFTTSIPEIVGELMDFSRRLVPIEELHNLASEAGAEREFLFHFGAKILPNKASEEVAFWVGLTQEKLAVAFRRESVTPKMQVFYSRQDLDRNLSTLGLFAFLGRSTRLFLSGMGIKEKDLDEQVKDFLSYLECGGLFVYPEMSFLPLYQLFMEVVAEEIGWLDFYSEPYISHHDRKRSKQHAIQAKKEIILPAVFSVCSNVFSGFAHFSNSTQQSLDANMVTFLHRSRDLLTLCLEDYWAAYYRSGELLKFAERFAPQPVIPLGKQGATNVFTLPEVQRKLADLMVRGTQELTPECLSQMSKPLDSDTMEAITLVKLSNNADQTKLECQGFIRKHINKLISSSRAVMTGTRILFVDISIAMGFFLKRVRGHELTEWEKKKLTRTLADIALIIPVTILMLLPVSAVGHAAILAAIKKYIPSLIPSSYSSERLGIVKQLNRTKKMELQPWATIEDVSSIVS